MIVIVSIFICIFLSAFFSCAEMAFVSCNRLRTRQLAGEGKRSAQMIDAMRREVGKFLASILFGNNLVNVTATALLTYFLESRFGIENELLITALMAPFLIIYAETVPKSYGRERADEIIYRIAPFLRLFYRLTAGIAHTLVLISDAIVKPFGVSEKKNPFVTREEFFSLIEESARKGVVEPEQKRLIDMILNFERVRVREAMSPLSEVPMVEISSRVREVRERARKTQARYFLVYEEIPSIVVGIVFVYDMLLEENEDRGLRDYLHSPLFLFGGASAERAFLKLQENRQSVAIVLDEQGEVIGTLEIEDLLAL